MRKFLFFAFTLVAGALAMTSCENNPDVPDQQNTTELSEYYGKWYLDSVNMNGHTSSHMQTVINFIDETHVVFGAEDSCTYEYKDNIVTINRGSVKLTFEAKSLDKDYAVIYGASYEGGEPWIFYFSHLPAEDSGTEQAVSEANLMGKYKYIYGTITDTKDGVSNTYVYTFGPGMLQLITLKSDHKVLFETNNAKENGYWSVKAAEKKITWAAADSYADLMNDPHWYDIVTLSDNWLILGYESTTYDGTHRVYREYYVRMK